MIVNACYKYAKQVTGGIWWNSVTFLVFWLFDEFYVFQFAILSQREARPLAVHPVVLRNISPARFLG